MRDPELIANLQMLALVLFMVGVGVFVLWIIKAPRSGLTDLRGWNSVHRLNIETLKNRLDAVERRLAIRDDPLTDPDHASPPAS